jgi:hypothetical protein
MEEQASVGSFVKKQSVRMGSVAAAILLLAAGAWAVRNRRALGHAEARIVRRYRRLRRKAAGAMGRCDTSLSPSEVRAFWAERHPDAEVALGDFVEAYLGVSFGGRTEDAQTRRLCRRLQSALRDRRRG